MLCMQEDVNHVLFECVMAKFVWVFFKEALGWDRIPKDMADFMTTWIPLYCQGFHLKLLHFAVVAWALWTNMNKIAIEHKFPASPADVLDKIDC